MKNLHDIWKYDIMKDLHDIGLRGRLPNFISNFLSDRSFNLRIGSTSSDTFEQEQGVPQGKKESSEIVCSKESPRTT